MNMQVVTVVGRVLLLVAVIGIMGYCIFML